MREGGNLRFGMLATILSAILMAPANAPERPRDIWVFRSVLDRNARMLTAALSEKLWVAYDTNTCSLYKAWTGGVKFDGAVYTTVHGPQPTSLGTPYILQDDKQTWSLGGSSLTPRYMGYKLIEGQVQLHWRFSTTADQQIEVYETPEARPQGDKIGLERAFQVTGLKAGQALRLEVFESQNAEVLPGSAKSLNTGIVPPGTEGVPTHAFEIPAGKSKVTMAFVQSGTPGGIQESEEPPRPKPVPQESTQPVLEPGLALRLYYTGVDLSKIPQLISGQTPNYSVVIDKLNLGNSDFGGFEDQFLIHISGYIQAPVAGSYEFELASDDGSRLMIGDNLIVDNDGLHGAQEVKTGRAEMIKGYNPISIEMFENAGDAAIRLRWKKPGDKEFSDIPVSVLGTQSGEVRVTAPGKKRIYGVEIFRPGDRSPLEAVHPSYTLSQARPDDFHPRIGGIGFLPNGNMLICTWDPDGAVYEITGWTGPESGIKVKRIAAGLAEPLGLKCVGDRIFVLQKQELTELIDNDKDGQIDEYRCVANGWGVTANFHEFAFGLEYRDGKFYGNLATAINPGGSSTQPQNPDRGRTIEIDEKTGKFHFVLSGLRTPNGIGFGAMGKLYIADNQGDWLPSSKIMLVKEGAFYGNRSVEPIAKRDTPEDPPVVWLPQNEIGNSPSQIAPLNDGPYKGQMVHGDVTHGGLKRVYVEEVDGVLQGCVFRMIQGLEAGINRVVVAPDGSFIVGGIGSTGNWGQTGKLGYGLQRLKYNGNSTFEMLSVSPRQNGLEVRFTEPVSDEVGDKPSYYEVKQWRYEPTNQYGGPKMDEEDLAVKSATFSPDRKSLFLEVDGLKEGHVVYLRLHPSIQAKDFEFIWATEAWLTVNKIPNKRGQAQPATNRQPKSASTDLTASIENFKGYNKPAVPSGWSLKDGVLSFAPGKEGGDLRTAMMVENFELEFEWRISKGGNSGVIYLSEERNGYPWETGPEYQILDNLEHSDGQNPLTSAASLYALYPADFDYTRPVGEWNTSKIVVRNGKVEHWLNHKLIVSADLNSEDFAQRKAMSKFAGAKDYGTVRKGYIVFQDHGDPVWYRNIRIKSL